MAAGFGVAAVRALARSLRVPGVFRSSATSSSERANASLGREERSASAARATRPGCDGPTQSHATGEGLSERMQEGVEEHSASSSDEDSVAEHSRVALRTRTFSSSEIPSPSQFLDSQALATYSRLHTSVDMASSVSSGRDSVDSRIDPGNAESDADEMYMGPLQPVRTSARSDFPACAPRIVACVYTPSPSRPRPGPSFSSSLH
eukprot:TRINITY_DN23813_c0_g1_i2.p1 TRINITY_DN23813_c0_g1~~TRINITY_DN23813_c0_g1_i2.p1  ORF type:complete len:205 (+),score=19.29 TRINITY_DN23813_c0_g1_i2:68-682(+)